MGSPIKSPVRTQQDKPTVLVEEALRQISNNPDEQEGGDEFDRLIK